MSRFNFMKNFKAYTLRMKDQRKQNIAILRSYLKKQRSVIMDNTRRKILRGTLWVGLLSVSYYFIHRIYSQKLQVQRMQKKLTQLYPSIVTKIHTQGKNEVYYVVPEYDDQLVNIIQMCWKFHYKVIVNSQLMEPQMRNENINKFLKEIPEAVRDKCIVVNLQKLKNVDIDEVNGTVKVQSGITCQQMNERLSKLGYQPIFPDEIAQNLNETVYNAVVNNYPTNNGPISKYIVNLDLISPQGQYFRSSNQNNQYGSTPNLNNIFVGTGGIFGLPIRVNFKTEVQSVEGNSQRKFEIQSNDLNQKLLITRKLRQILLKSSNVFNFSISNTSNDKIQITISSDKFFENALQNIGSKFRQQLPDLKEKEGQNGTENEKKLFNIFFNVNQAGFEKFLVLKQRQNLSGDKLAYTLCQDLLKVNCKDENLFIELISELCSQNAVVVWCRDHKFMKEIKKVTDQSEVGSELMKILVQIREGIDHKKIYYTHNRYEEYFAKGPFRKLTEVFW